MREVYKMAEALTDELREIRRYLHQHAEVGDELAETGKFVMHKLAEYGYSPEQICKSGIVATVGGKKGGKVLLLRADMDALRMDETSGLPFASQTGCTHSCGHDIHTASLLVAAKILKEMEHELDGTVKLMFQPSEETLSGADTMIKAGVLENPKVDAAFSMHVAAENPVKCFGYNRGGAMASSDNFEITITGRSCHGAMPHFGIDPINVGCHIHTALQEIISREANANETAVITIGQFIAGESVNVIPEKALLRGTMRTRSPQVRELMLRRMPEIVNSVATAFKAKAEIKMLACCPPLINNAEMCDMYMKTIEELGVDGITLKERYSMGSEDFAFLASAVPSYFGSLGGAQADESVRFPAHNASIVFDEDCLPLGAALYVAFAKKWLSANI